MGTLPEGLSELAEVFGLSDLITAIVSAIVSIMVARYVLAGKLAETSQSRESAIWKASRGLREDLSERIAVLEADRDRMTAEIADMHEERVRDAYVRAYAQLLFETFPDPPGAPEPPPVVARLLGIEIPRPQSVDEPAPDPQIRDPTSE